MAFISLGKINKNLIPLILSCIFCFLNRIVNQIEGTELFENVILTNIFISGANLLIIIPYLISVYKTKKSKHNNINNNTNNINNVTADLTGLTSLEYIYQHSKIKDVKNKKLFVLLIAMIFFANYNMFIYTIKVKADTWIMFILFVPLFYYLLFKAKLYKYHYLSIIIVLIFGIIIEILLKHYIIPDNDYLLLIFSILRIILLSFDYVLIKYTNEKKSVSLYTIGFFTGFLNFIFFIIYAILDSSFIGLYEYQEYFDKFNSWELFVVFALMLTQLGLYITLLFVVKINSPCHIFIVFVFGQFPYYFKGIEISIEIVIVIICLFLILFFSLVFNEIIELNFLRLSFNVKRNIVLRSEKEMDETYIRESTLSIGDDEIMIELSNKTVEEYN